MEVHIDSPPSFSHGHTSPFHCKQVIFFLFSMTPACCSAGRWPPRWPLCFAVSGKDRGERSMSCSVSLTSTLWHQLTPEEEKQPLVTPGDLWWPQALLLILYSSARPLMWAPVSACINMKTFKHPSQPKVRRQQVDAWCMLYFSDLTSCTLLMFRP